LPQNTLPSASTNAPVTPGGTEIGAAEDGPSLTDGAGLSGVSFMKRILERERPDV
jgi:hypothetical protein